MAYTNWAPRQHARWKYSKKYKTKGLPEASWRTLSELVSSLHSPQPQVGKHCTLALYNLLSGQSEWISVDCTLRIPLNMLVCYVSKPHKRENVSPKDINLAPKGVLDQDILLVYVRNFYTIFENVWNVISSVSAFHLDINQPYAAVASYQCEDPYDIRLGEYTGLLKLGADHEETIRKNILKIIAGRCEEKRNTEVYSYEKQNVLVYYHSRSYTTTNPPNAPTAITTHLIDASWQFNNWTCPQYSFNVGELCLLINVTSRSKWRPTIMPATGSAIQQTELELGRQIAYYHVTYTRIKPDKTSGQPDRSTIPISIHVTESIGRTVGCYRSQFTCTDGHCVSGGYVLDGIEDCPDGSDELSLLCGGPKTNHTPSTNCNFTYFHCGQGEYILWRMVCDGHSDCNNGNDELICQSAVSSID